MSLCERNVSLFYQTLIPDRRASRVQTIKGHHFGKAHLKKCGDEVGLVVLAEMRLSIGMLYTYVQEAALMYARLVFILSSVIS